MTIQQRLANLRQQMQHHQVDAYIIPGSDAHQSEYLCDHWQGRQWISGFTGTAGTVVVTQQHAALWTDGRYMIQAARQLEDTPYELLQTRLPDSVSIGHWLKTHLDANAVVGFDGRSLSMSEVSNIADDLDCDPDDFSSHLDLLTTVWEDRPALPDSPLFLHDEHYAGLSATDKISQLRQKLAQQECQWHLLSSLDDINWLLNIRGSDVPYCPLVMAFYLQGPESGWLFVDSDKISDSDAAILNGHGIQLQPYDAVYQLTEYIPADTRVMVAPSRLNHQLYSRLHQHCQLVLQDNPTSGLKAIKNATEISHFKECLRRDGLVMSKFGCWLAQQVPEGNVTELSAEQKLIELRSRYDTYRGDSFRTIAGYQDHGAMMHYGATADSNASVSTRGLFLVDSGGLFLNGTTDITRTYSFNNLSEQQRRDYTLVLRGFIGLARARFKKGTRGTQLDVLARAPLWQQHIDYACGTGHGVGFFLNVHEGPQGFSQQMVDVAFEPSMILTNEPGIYRDGEYGIRIENMMIVVEDGKNEHGEFYRFEQLTLAPINCQPIITDMMTSEEIGWLNDYHQDVFRQLSPELTGDELAWLTDQTQPISRQ